MQILELSKLDEREWKFLLAMLLEHNNQTIWNSWHSKLKGIHVKKSVLKIDCSKMTKDEIDGDGRVESKQ